VGSEEGWKSQTTKEKKGSRRGGKQQELNNNRRGMANADGGGGDDGNPSGLLLRTAAANKPRELESLPRNCDTGHELTRRQPRPTGLRWARHPPLVWWLSRVVRLHGQGPRSTVHGSSPPSSHDSWSAPCEKAWLISLAPR